MIESILVDFIKGIYYKTRLHHKSILNDSLKGDLVKTLEPKLLVLRLRGGTSNPTSTTARVMALKP